MDEDILHYALEQLTATTELDLQVQSIPASAPDQGHDG